MSCLCLWLFVAGNRDFAASPGRVEALWCEREWRGGAVASTRVKRHSSGSGGNGGRLRAAAASWEARGRGPSGEATATELSVPIGWLHGGSSAEACRALSG